VTPSPQLDQMLAPIALYPDPLLAEVLTASTYPIEIVQADRWLQNPATGALRSDPTAFQNALAQQSWDPNVKALTFFPQVLQSLDTNIQWTQGLGNAFLTEQPSVMASVQHLRQLAMASGSLNSTPQQSVVNENGMITILPTSQQTLYVPYYNASAYGAWPWPGMPPVIFGPPPGVYANGSALAFDSGVLVSPTWFYIVETNWRNNRIDHHYGSRAAEVPITPNTTVTTPNIAIGGAVEVTPWTHDPAHRYVEADEATRARLVQTPAATAPQVVHVQQQGNSNSGRSNTQPAQGAR